MGVFLLTAVYVCVYFISTGDGKGIYNRGLLSVFLAYSKGLTDFFFFQKDVSEGNKLAVIQWGTMQGKK